MTDRKLIDMAAEVMANSYSPYSRFKVGAAIECSDGTVYTGCNIENSAFSAAICAESSALATAVSNGKYDFKRIAVISEGASYCFPCGVCRQRLSEFSPTMEVLCARADGRYESYRLNTLIPKVFGLEQSGNL